MVTAMAKAAAFAMVSPYNSAIKYSLIMATNLVDESKSRTEAIGVHGPRKQRPAIVIQTSSSFGGTLVSRGGFGLEHFWLEKSHETKGRAHLRLSPRKRSSWRELQGMVNMN
jgi:hypothetical protein